MNLNAYVYWSSSRAPNRCLRNNGKSTPGIKLHHFRVNILYAMEFTRASFVWDEFKEIKACACIKLLGLGWSPSIWWSERGRASKSKGDPKKGQGSCAPWNVVIVIRGNEYEATAKAIELLLRLGCTFYTKVKIIYNICRGSFNKQRIKNTTYSCCNEYRQGLKQTWTSSRSIILLKNESVGST